ncbi:MAG: protein kinase [Chloroflexota bacterium]|nr:protein kinase [Chloroflexota bacterium]
MAVDSNELLGQALGTCTLQSLLGRGGMGVVYLARQSRPRRTVAVKVLVPGMHSDPKARAEFLVRFRREADAIAGLDHVNIMPIFEYGEQGELAFLVMPYVTGGTLRTKLDQRGILPLSEAIPIIEQAAAAIDNAHAQGIVHRDLKPGNILFHADGRVLLADFGLAKVIRGNEEHDSNGRLSTLTGAGIIVGTPEYLSPEQSTGQPIGPYTDIYALGIVLYQMLGGRVPFTGASPVAIALKHALEAPPALLSLNPALPPSVEAVVMKALAKLPEERYASAGELAHALRSAASGAPITPRHLNEADVENIATVTIPDEQKALAERATDDIANAPTSERTRVSPAEKESNDDISQIRTAERPGVNAGKNAISQITTAGRSRATPAAATALSEYRPSTPAEEPELHEAATEEAPRLVSPEAPTPLASTAPPIQSRPAEIGSTRAAQQHIAQTPVLPTPPQQRKPARRRPGGWQSASMMLLGSLLTLLLLVSGFIVYLNLMPKGSTHTKNIAKTTQTVKAKTPTARPFTAPAPLVSAAGKALYGTALPGPNCDTQGGQWSKQPGVTITCPTSGTQLTNSDSGGTAGIFLNKLANGQSIPENYVLQVQVSTDTRTQGDFGVFFRHQPGSPTGGYAFLLNATGTWKGNLYNQQNGTVSTPVSLQVFGNMAGTFTLNIVVQEDTYTFYVNGNKQGRTESGQYMSGNLGLVADGGTSVSFKNLVIYASA